MITTYFTPSTKLFHLTIGKKYAVKYTDKGRQIVDDNGKKRIIRPITEVEITRE